MVTYIIPEIFLVSLLFFCYGLTVTLQNNSKALEFSSLVAFDLKHFARNYVIFKALADKLDLGQENVLNFALFEILDNGFGKSLNVIKSNNVNYIISLIK